jgi:hypothetical protein
VAVAVDRVSSRTYDPPTLEGHAMPIWVHIEPVFEPDGQEAKTALTQSLKTALSKEIFDRLTKALPKDKFNTKKEDMPKVAPTDFRSLKIVAEMKLKVETRGSSMIVDCQLNTVWEGIRAPILRPGNLIVWKKMGGAAKNRGSGEKGIISGVVQVLDSTVDLIVKEVLKNPHFTSYGKKIGLAL